MISILTCDNCRRTSAVRAETQVRRLGRREETWLIWCCPRCGEHRQWLLPQGRNAEDSARESRKSSKAYEKSHKRKDVYLRASNATPEKRKLIFFGELVWWWRKEAGITQVKAVERSGLSARHWRRIESGKIRPHEDNIVKIVQAAKGGMVQAYLLIDPEKDWGEEFERRLVEAEKQKKDAFFRKLHEDAKLSPDMEQNLGVALRKLGNVLIAESADDRFLFYAYIIHQAFWNRRLDGPVVVDERKTELIPLIKKLIDVFNGCERKRDQYEMIHLMIEEVAYFMPGSLLLELVTYFIQQSYTSISGREETCRKVGGNWDAFTPREKLVLALFDLIEPTRQSALLNACEQIQANTKS